MEEKTKQQLLEELKALQTKIGELEKFKLDSRRAEERLRESEEKFRLTFENAKDAILWSDIKTCMIIKCNKAAEILLEKKQDEIIGKHYTIIHPPQKKEYYANMFKKYITQKRAFDNEVEVITKSGTIKPVHITASVTLVGKQPIIQGIFRDITQRKKVEKELERLNRELIRSNKRLKHLSLRDLQTGLYNHRYLGEVIEAEFYRAKRYGHPLSVIMLDIDYFKSINDVYGHQFGDLVLKQLGRLLKRMVRRYDVVVRFGGEEFIIICPGIDYSAALILAQRLLDAINLYNFGNKKLIVKLRLSMAVTTYPEDRLIVKAMDLIELAAQILERVKEHGGNRVYSSVDIAKTKHFDSRKDEDTADVNFLKEKIVKLTKRSNQSLIEAVFAFAKTIKLKDSYTGEHVERIVHYATEIAQTLNLPKDEIERIRQASMLHDLGKIGISDKILLKQAILTKREFEEIKNHPQIGVDIIRPIQFLHSIIPFILYHHERWDGRGYPKGLKREEIPVGARIVAVADVYQALISNRPYRQAYSKHEAMRIIKHGSGTQFDPRIASAFLQILQPTKQT